MIDFPVAIEQPAIDQLKRWIARKGGDGAFIRIGVKGGGCSGYEYVLKIDTKRYSIDSSLHVGELEVVCDGKSAPILAGSVISYTGNLLGGGGFSFENPNAARSCGCGTSFSLKPKPETGPKP